LILELPPWQKPSWRSVLSSANGRAWQYIKKAGTVILTINIVIWLLMYFPRLPEEQARTDANPLEYSVAGRIGKAVEPVSRIAGFDWRDNVALMGGFAAKEVIVSSLSTAYSMEDSLAEEEDETEQIARRLQNEPGWSSVKALALMVFVMLYAPCTGACVTIWRESGTWRWMLVVIIFSTTLAFIMATLIYQLGTILFG
jgi:ferrous iron transport protein B